MHGENAYPVLHLSRCGPIYGLARQLLYFTNHIDRQRFPLIVAVDEPGPLKDELIRTNVGCVFRPMSPWRSFPYLVSRHLDARRLVKLARENGCRIVHAQDVWKAEYAYFIAERLGIPSVVHIRGPLDRRDIVKHRLIRADAIIAIGRRYVDDLIAAGIPAERITLIDDAVDFALFSAEKYPRPARADGIVRIGMVGRISREKRVRELLEAVALLPQEIVQRLDMTIIGATDLDYQREIESDLDRLRLRGLVRFPGGIPAAQMPGQLANLDLLVTLAGGSVIYEAMAMGTPVLTVSRDSRPRQHTRHDQTAWCLGTDQPQEVAKALALLADDEPLRRRLGAAGQDWVRRHLGIPAMVRATQETYERLLKHA